MATIEIDDLRKEFGDLVAVDDVSLTVHSGELLCLLGPSGCGKSTTLRMIDGLERPTAGRVFIDETDVTDQQAYDRDCSMVFQSWALFPYKRVIENVAFGLKMKGVGRAERRERARETLELMHMGDFVDHRPADLSGGEKQRVALARSLTMDPSVLLLDEPLSNLDKKLREEMQIELKNIHEEFGKTMIHVTHDQDEAFTLADRIGIMNEGRLVQIGTPREVYANPVNQFVEEFIGETNFIRGEVETMGAEELTVALDFGPTVAIPYQEETEALSVGAPVTVSLRPEVMSISPAPAEAESEVEPVPNGGGEHERVPGTIRNILYRGSTVRFYVDVGGGELFVERSVGDFEGLDEGDDVALSWDRSELLCFDAAGTTVWC